MSALTLVAEATETLQADGLLTTVTADDIQRFSAETLDVATVADLRDALVSSAGQWQTADSLAGTLESLAAAITVGRDAIADYRYRVAVMVASALRHGLWQSQATMAKDLGLSPKIVSQLANVGRARLAGLPESATRDLQAALYGSSRVQSAAALSGRVKALTSGAKPADVAAAIRRDVAEAKSADRDERKATRKARPNDGAASNAGSTVTSGAAEPTVPGTATTGGDVLLAATTGDVAPAVAVARALAAAEREVTLYAASLSDKDRARAESVAARILATLRKAGE